MTRIEALEELAAKVEAGEVKDWRPYYIERVFGTKRNAVLAVASFDGSLDAAKALHDAVLPGWRYTLRNWGKVEVFTEEWNDENTHPKHFKSACIRGNLARAWLLSILRALIAQEKTQC